MKPDDDYLLKLGFAHYWFQYVEWVSSTRFTTRRAKT